MIYARTRPTNDCFWNFAETTVPISKGGSIFFRCEYYGHKGIFFADDFDFSDLKSKQIKGIFKLEGLFFNCILDIENEKISLEDFIDIYLPFMDYYKSLYENEFYVSKDELKRRREEYNDDEEEKYLTLSEKLEQLGLSKYFNQIKDIIRRC